MSIYSKKEGIYIEEISIDCGLNGSVLLCSEGNFNSQIVIDTATVNNKTYSEVYKLHQENETIKVIYFAKTYGFIKIELSNGDKAELIPNH